MTRTLWLGLLALALLYIVRLRRALRAALLRGDRYRDLAAELDRRAA